MGLIGGSLGYALLRLFSPRSSVCESCSGGGNSKSSLVNAFGDDFFELIQGKTVVDFGCGAGEGVVEMALNGAERVIGIDIQENLLDVGREWAEKQGVADRCSFTTATDQSADIVVSKDAFEHFEDPSSILEIMSSLLSSDGYLLASFGPTWLHPYGGHLFSVFPWAHLLFTEYALTKWRADFRSDGARSFSEVAGGLNQITIAKFERVVEGSLFQFDNFETVPIKGMRFLKIKAFREFGTSIVRCRLKLRD